MITWYPSNICFQHGFSSLHKYTWYLTLQTSSWSHECRQSIYWPFSASMIFSEHFEDRIDNFLGLMCYVCYWLANNIVKICTGIQFKAFLCWYHFPYFSELLTHSDNIFWWSSEMISSTKSWASLFGTAVSSAISLVSIFFIKKKTRTKNQQKLQPNL